MVVQAHVKQGRIVLDEQSKFPDGVKVRVELVDSLERPTINQRLKNVIGKAKGLPSDFAANHDHYIHGAPKVEQ